MVWTPERMSLAMQLWKDGLSSAQIAVRLGGVSRNAVIGVVHRHGHKYGIGPTIIRQRPKSGPARFLSLGAARRRKVASAHVEAPKAVRPPVSRILPLPPPAVTDVPRIRFADREPSQCAWIVGEPTADAMCCGAKNVPGISYCEHHARRAYQPPQVKTKDSDRFKPIEPALEKPRGVKVFA